jgi:long-chain acyl-CoA synthetase
MGWQYSTTQKKEIQRVLLDLIYKIKQINPSEDLADKTSTSDLGLDSLAKVELTGAIQSHFGVQLEDDEITTVNTLDELIDTVIHKQKQHKTNTIQPIKSNIDTAITFSFNKNTLASSLIRTPIHRLLTGLLQQYFQLEVHGKEHIPFNKPFIIAANHASHLDNPTLMLAAGLPFDEFVLMAAKDYFFERKSLKLKLLKYFFNLVPFDRKAEPSAMKDNIAWCKACLEQHKKLILFPEATRSINGQLQSFKGGGALLAYELDIPILPAYIQGAYECLPKGKSWPKKGKITVSFGKPIFMENYKNAMVEMKYQLYKQITHDLEQQIKQLGNIL